MPENTKIAANNSKPARAPATTMNKVFKGLQTAGGIGMSIGSLALGGLALQNAYNKITANMQYKNLLREVAAQDPMFSSVPEEQLKEWYATIVHFAPKFAMDKSAVKEVLHNFATFGRVDVNTLKMLADTEKSLQASKNSMKSWGDFIGALGNASSTFGHLGVPPVANS